MTNAFSKLLENHVNKLRHVEPLVRVHPSLKTTPAVEVLDDVMVLIDERMPKPGPRGPYRSRRGG